MLALDAATRRDLAKATDRAIDLRERRANAATAAECRAEAARCRREAIRGILPRVPLKPGDPPWYAHAWRRERVLDLLTKIECRADRTPGIPDAVRDWAHAYADLRSLADEIDPPEPEPDHDPRWKLAWR